MKGTEDRKDAPQKPTIDHTMAIALGRWCINVKSITISKAYVC
jgi:hypothetical protein